MAFSFGGDSVCAASNEGIGSSDVMRLAAPSLRPSRRFVGTCGVLSELFALSFMEIGPLVLRAYATMLKQRLRRATLRDASKERCQKLIAWRMMMTVEESRSVVGAAPDSPRHICGHPSRRYSQRSRVDRHLAQALAGCGEDRVGDCGDNGRSSSFAHTAGWLGAFDDVHFNRRR